MRLMRVDKPIGTLLLLWPTLWGLWIAGQGHPPWHIVFIFILGTFLMRSAGCVINDYADKDFDKHVSRTKNRPLVSAEISAKEALLLAAVLSLCAFLLVLPLNRLTLMLSLPAAFLAASYPYTKRFFALPQAYLGIAFGFGIPMAFAAIVNQIPSIAWVMVLANVFWTLAYDTEYAMVDRPDDLKIGIKTAAITFGKFDVLAIMFCYSACLGLLAYVGQLVGCGLFFYMGLGLAAAITIYHCTLIHDRCPERCFQAFRHNNWFGSIIFVGLMLDYFLQ